MNSFLTKISDAFSKDILFGSFLPALLFVVFLGGTLFFMLGIDNLMTIYNGLDTNSTLLITFLFTVGMIVGAYVLHSIREINLEFWCGTSLMGNVLLSKMKKSHLEIFDGMNPNVVERLEWIDAYMNFQTKCGTLLNSPPPVLSIEAQQAQTRTMDDLLEQIDSFSDHPTEVQRERFFRGINSALATYGLTAIHQVIRKLERWEDQYSSRNAIAAAEFDKKFGSRINIRPTELGNIVQAYNEYGYKRYNMEPYVFWPRLQKVIDKEYFEIVIDQRISLDFAVTSATLSSLIFIYCIFGPFIYSNHLFWMVLACLSLLLMFLSYRMAVAAASALGQYIRSCYDLFRLKLLTDLNLEWPGDTSVEKETWKEFSRIVSYGLSGKLKLVKPEE